MQDARPPWFVVVACTPQGAEVPLILPEKLSRAKLVVELEPSKDGHATDLAGDAGAVGRFMVSGPPSNETVRLDLKGAALLLLVPPPPTHTQKPLKKMVNRAGHQEFFQ
jgi:hypothetical protein